MSPTKRESSPSADEVCKKLKGDITKTDTEPATDIKDNDTLNNNNNNNVDTKNGTDKQTIEHPDEEEAKPQTGDVDIKETDKNTDATPQQQANGSKKENGDGESKEKEEKAKPNKDNNSDADSNDSKAEPSIDSAEQTKTNAPEPPEPEEEPSGTLLICGGANWDMTGRKELPKNAKKPVEVHPAARNLWAPHRVCLDPANPDKSSRVKGVFSGCNACHSVIVTTEGVAMTFGRNDKGQLGLGDTETRFVPTVVEALKNKNVVAAACGRSHTLFLTSDGVVYGCGDNKMGQCGTNQPSVQQITTPTKISFKENKPIVKLACGAEFSLIVDIEGSLYSFGHPEHGQLGHNSEGKYFTTGNKYAFHCEHSPRRIVAFIEKSRDGHITALDNVSIVDIACGTNHSLAVDKKHRCFSWGFGGYHRLGHSETKNEFVPRSIRVFDVPNSHGRGAARVFAGATHSMATDVNGLLYFWGQNKSSGEATMYPKNVQDLCGWRIRSVACANRSIVLAADESVVSWGPSPTYGELGYGEGKSKSSTTPQEVRPLDGIHVLNVVCGFGHTMMIARDKNPEELGRINKLRKWP